MTVSFGHTVIWHVVFHPGPCAWGRYRHVSLAGFWDDTWINLDLHRRAVSVGVVYAHDEVQDYLSYLLAYHTVLRFGKAREDASHFWRPMTCVSFAKQTLGVRSGALRPDGLLRCLVRDYDAEIINDAGNPKGNGGTAPAAYPG